LDGAGATITTVLPSGGLPGYKSAIHDLSLTLVASQNIVNNGAISSAANLTAVAGGGITSAPVVGGPARQASVQAVGEVNLLSNSVVNHGVVTSTAGDVHVAGPSIYASAAAPFASSALSGVLPQNINIINTSGTIQALEGTINFGGAQLAQSALLNLTGGNLTALAINLQAGLGAIQVDVNDVSGVVNVSGGSAQFGSDSRILDLGIVDVTGDPTFFNMGDITINGDIDAGGQSLAILAGGNIKATRPVNIQAISPVLGGQNVYIEACSKLIPVVSTTITDTLPSENRLAPGQSI
jgi:hypothetical protein